jgi:hypothetical protein
MEKAIKVVVVVVVLLVSMVCVSFADMDSGVPTFLIADISGDGTPESVFVSVGGAVDKSGRCWQGGYLPSSMILNTSTEVGKQLFSMLVSANLAGKSVTVWYNLNSDTSCTVTGGGLGR